MSLVPRSNEVVIRDAAKTSMLVAAVQVYRNRHAIPGYSLVSGAAQDLVESGYEKARRFIRERKKTEVSKRYKYSDPPRRSKRIAGRQGARPPSPPAESMDVDSRRSVNKGV